MTVASPIQIHKHYKCREIYTYSIHIMNFVDIILTGPLIPSRAIKRYASVTALMDVFSRFL